MGATEAREVVVVGTVILIKGLTGLIAGLGIGVEALILFFNDSVFAGPIFAGSLLIVARRVEAATGVTRAVRPDGRVFATDFGMDAADDDALGAEALKVAVLTRGGGGAAKQGKERNETGRIEKNTQGGGKESLSSDSGIIKASTSCEMMYSGPGIGI